MITPSSLPTFGGLPPLPVEAVYLFVDPTGDHSRLGRSGLDRDYFTLPSKHSGGLLESLGYNLDRVQECWLLQARTRTGSSWGGQFDQPLETGVKSSGSDCFDNVLGGM